MDMLAQYWPILVLVLILIVIYAKYGLKAF
jgi:hypothetical protein